MKKLSKAQLVERDAILGREEIWGYSFVLDEETILNILMGRIYKVRTGLGSDGWGPFLSKDEVEAYLTGACVVWYEGRWQGAWADNIRLVGLSP